MKKISKKYIFEIFVTLFLVALNAGACYMWIRIYIEDRHNEYLSIIAIIITGLVSILLFGSLFKLKK